MGVWSKGEIARIKGKGKKHLEGKRRAEQTTDRPDFGEEGKKTARKLASSQISGRKRPVRRPNHSTPDVLLREILIAAFFHSQALGNRKVNEES